MCVFTFNAACNAHDNCYMNTNCAQTKEKCDNEFRRSLEQVCSRSCSVPNAQASCLAQAWVYYQGVKRLGKKAWSSAQRCNKCERRSMADTGACEDSMAPEGSQTEEEALDPPFADEDGDLLPDEWEVQVGLEIGSIDTEEDYDGDGLNNVCEFLWGSDPFLRDTDGDGIDDLSYALSQIDTSVGGTPD
ncbi:MAG TPA: hypothetical protein PKH26_00220 [Phycisphaerae bacterium]|nr:hypothetical protein [Phycisphaerae bacterium]